MQQSFDPNVINRIQFLVGEPQRLEHISEVKTLKPFDERIVDFLNELSRTIMKKPASRQYSDVVTFAFWIRKGSISELKEKHLRKDDRLCFGRGTAFHIAPSNVPVNFAYSLAVGLMTGNKNIVRIPSKDFPQVEIIVSAINETIKNFKLFEDRILLVRYSRDKEVNDILSSVSDTRIIWGGDETIAEIRKSPLPPRSTEITFADRYSLSVIDSEEYLSIEDKAQVAKDFYNDTYFSDQNACTSPALMVWTGSKKSEAKEIFWRELHSLVKEKYTFHDIQATNKLTGLYETLSDIECATLVEAEDNLITRIRVGKLTDDLMNHRVGSGYFFEYDCEDPLELEPVCNNKRCQTVGYLGSKDFLNPLLETGIKGIDRIVPIGKTMDFDLIWDGYDLMSALTRIISVV